LLNSNFILHPFDYVTGSTLGEIKAVYHSHSNSEIFSQKDLTQTNLHNIPFIMYYIPKDKFKVTTPFKLGENDCYTPIQKFFANKGIKLPNYKRSEGWKEKTPGIIEKSYKEQGFIEIHLNELKKDDLILFKFKRDFAEHIGIYLGNNKFLHNSKEGIEKIMDYNKWAKYAFIGLRYDFDA
jgi:cell wall-associated NlpC family hydrolase